jgi:hypothetical protein
MRKERTLAWVVGVAVSLWGADRAQLLEGGQAAPQAARSMASPAGSPAGTLRVLSDLELPAELRLAVDVRWATDKSVFLALKRSGVVEASLDGKGPPPKQVIGGEQAPGGFWLSMHLAASPSYLVAGAPLFAMTWRRLESPERKEEAFEGIHDLDVQGSRVAVVGSRRDDAGRFAPDGAIAWMGSLDKGLSDLKPLLFDARGPGAPAMNACGPLMIGATRFLADGSLLVVPGVQPGIFRFDSQAKLLHTWDTVALGVDTDCAAVSKELAATLAGNFPRRLAWINERRIVDEVLPLPAGPGLLVRSARQGQTQWVLEVLRADGSVAQYEVPFRTPSAFGHLKGDLRGDRLVLLRWEYREDGKPEGAPLPHLVIAAVPGP